MKKKQETTPSKISGSLDDLFKELSEIYTEFMTWDIDLKSAKDLENKIRRVLEIEVSLEESSRYLKLIQSLSFSGNPSNTADVMKLVTEATEQIARIKACAEVVVSTGNFKKVVKNFLAQVVAQKFSLENEIDREVLLKTKQDIDGYLEKTSSIISVCNKCQMYKVADSLSALNVQIVVAKTHVADKFESMDKEQVRQAGHALLKSYLQDYDHIVVQLEQLNGLLKTNHWIENSDIKINEILQNYVTLHGELLLLDQKIKSLPQKNTNYKESKFITEPQVVIFDKINTLRQVKKWDSVFNKFLIEYNKYNKYKKCSPTPELIPVEEKLNMELTQQVDELLEYCTSNSLLEKSKYNPLLHQHVRKRLDELKACQNNISDFHHQFQSSFVEGPKKKRKSHKKIKKKSGSDHLTHSPSLEIIANDAVNSPQNLNIVYTGVGEDGLVLKDDCKDLEEIGNPPSLVNEEQVEEKTKVQVKLEVELLNGRDNCNSDQEKFVEVVKKKNKLLVSQEKLSSVENSSCDQKGRDNQNSYVQLNKTFSNKGRGPKLVAKSEKHVMSSCLDNASQKDRSRAPEARPGCAQKGKPHVRAPITKASMDKKQIESVWKKPLNLNSEVQASINQSQSKVSNNSESPVQDAPVTVEKADQFLSEVFPNGIKGTVHVPAVVEGVGTFLLPVDLTRPVLPLKEGSLSSSNRPFNISSSRILPNVSINNNPYPYTSGQLQNPYAMTSVQPVFFAAPSNQYLPLVQSDQSPSNSKGQGK